MLHIASGRCLSEKALAMSEKYHPKSEKYQPMTEEEKKELEEYEALTLKGLIEIHTTPSPYAYEEHYNRQLREEKIEKLGNAIVFSREFLEEKLANGVLVFWKKTYDRTESIDFCHHMRTFVDDKIRTQIRYSVEKGLEKGMEMGVRHEIDKLVKKIIKESKAKEKKRSLNPRLRFCFNKEIISCTNCVFFFFFFLFSGNLRKKKEILLRVQTRPTGQKRKFLAGIQNLVFRFFEGIQISELIAS
ncbi:hypothetical protein B9Z55_027192 [Caenorhabditis nigoni]|uniref:Uncharacterized protein n=1 Tax=Caenorhabditis nigoni TaxID=1611254 RepID=A0A2G5SGZ0_9PELO|nr:hypothetical protein B9Z55_027192 [Caenorhabditis nigoni]